jgi:sugar fermentation stimulation protein A
MRLPGLRRGFFLARPNRFGAWVEDAAGRQLYMHVPNSGRLAELLVAGAGVRWRAAAGGARRTAGDLVLVRHADGWVCVDARLPPRLLAEALARPPGLAPFGHCPQVVFEPRLGQGRGDLLLSGAATGTWIVETKSVTLAVEGVGLFPDAPTERGRRHVAELASLAAQQPTAQLRPAIAFICQRADVYSFEPNAATDPGFADELWRAQAAGVAVVAYRCRVDAHGIAIAEAIPVRLRRQEEAAGRRRRRRGGALAGEGG